MKNMSDRFFDDVYHDMCKAFEEKFHELATKLEGSGQYEDLNTMRKNAYELIEEFKVIEKVLPERIVDESNPDNLHILLEYIEIEGIMVPKPRIYKKTYMETRAEIQKKMIDGKIRWSVKLFNRDYSLQYIPLALNDFYWGQYLFSDDNKNDGCQFLLDALAYITYSVKEDDKVKTNEWRLLHKRFNEARGKVTSSLGGKGKLKEVEYLKPYILSRLSSPSSEGEWKSKKKFIDTIILDVVGIDKTHNHKYWNNDTGQREEMLYNRINKWLSNELKSDCGKFIRNKRKQ
ncbi:hypothetical protein PVO54_004712 [Enterobacter hormaechei]|uniref:hypothetical protein n=2 Tax=Klebsiella michiganensis TaxID=1134687 RepID=UPI0029699171|nr:hypothetical protein [Klebsiella michiganensis]EKM8121280.1 hypothetical protein [Enterobacter hormaechei]EKM8121912.1 hypothetical protein [Enterobacter hormaechei]MDW3072413.1 hypothetical protein [Klebsiella michiganensis]MDW3133015.1 hypothetical protein [Klebsiella michiganensis]MDZ5695498.1 hypothetical protein [Klebsiella michiganensis]